MGQEVEVDRDMFAGPFVDDDADRVFEALANPRRRRIYALLCERPRYLAELQRDLGEISQAALTRHLRVLGWARLTWAISERGPYARFQGDREQLLYVQQWLDHIEALPFQMPEDDDGSPQAKRRQRTRSSGK